MDSNAFARPDSHQVLTILIFTLLVISNISAACNSTTIIHPNSTQATYVNTTNVPFNSTQTYHQNATTPLNSPKTNYPQNTTIPSNYTQTGDHQNTTIPSNYAQTYITYIKTACSSSTYPSICHQSLSPYALKIEGHPLKLCSTSLSLVLKATYSASYTISELLESNNLTYTAEQVVKDCFDNVKNSIGELLDPVVAMGHLEDDSIDKEFQISNIKTWASAAITDDQTCSDGFDGENVDATVRDKIRKYVLNVARMSSNALYFINNLNH